MRTTIGMPALAAVAFAATAFAGAQTPQPSADEARMGRDASRKPVTITGCLKREAEVPGRSPNIAERAGIAEDYILTNATMKGHEQSPAGAQSDAAQSAEATGRTGAAGTVKWTMFKVEGIDDEELQRHLNKRVEVTGTLENLPGSWGMSAHDTPPAQSHPKPGAIETPENQPGTRTGTQEYESNEELPQIEATAIREVGSCQGTR